MLPESTRSGGSASPVIVSNPCSPGMCALDSLLTQALQLPEEERWKLVSQLRRTSPRCGSGSGTCGSGASRCSR